MSAATKRQRDPDETASLDGLIAEVVHDPEQWKRTPNDVLGGRKPTDLIGTDHEERLRELLRALKVGMAS